MSQRPASATDEVLFSVRDIRLTLAGAPILGGVSFDVFDRVRPNITTGQVVGVLGPSGVGKSRLMRIMAGLDPPDSGEVLGLKGAPIEQGQVGLVFQDYPLLRHRSVRANLEIAGVANGMPRAEARGRTAELLEAFHLSDRATFFPAQLSGGQRQRVAIAQQLVQPKHLLLLDEPFSGLDPAALEDVMHLIVKVANLDNVNTIVVVTHDIRAAMAVSDQLLLLGRGVTADGKPRSGGATICSSHDLVAEGLAWRPDVAELPRFVELEAELRRAFRQL